jgi:acetyl-CoA carboxylase biotin carboxyl carrier protein
METRFLMATQKVLSEVTGQVWKMLAKVGDTVQEEDQLMILESMKMEIPVLAPSAGKVIELLADEGDVVDEGAVVAVIQF